MKRKNNNKKKKRNIYILIIVFAVISIFLLSTTYGRYIYHGIRNYYLNSRNFFFNSDKLSEFGSYYQLDNWSGVDPVNVIFHMDSKKNNLVSSPLNITYDISYTCSSNVNCTATKDSGLIMNGNNTDSFTITMDPNVTLNGGDSIWLEVTASATSPYTKTLTGRFQINVGEFGLSYEIVDTAGNPYLDFKITNTIDYYKVYTAFGDYSVGDKLEIGEYLALSETDKLKCSAARITLSFDPSLFRLDMTNEAYMKNVSTTNSTLSDGYDYLNSVTFGIDALDSLSVRFYKFNTNNNYTYPYTNPTSVITFSSQ